MQPRPRSLLAGGDVEDHSVEKRPSLSSIDVNKMRGLSTESLYSSGCVTDDESEWDDRKDEEKLEKQELEIGNQYKRLSAINNKVDAGGSLFTAWNHRYYEFVSCFVC